MDIIGFLRLVYGGVARLVVLRPLVNVVGLAGGGQLTVTIDVATYVDKGFAATFRAQGLAQPLGVAVYVAYEGTVNPAAGPAPRLRLLALRLPPRPVLPYLTLAVESAAAAAPYGVDTSVVATIAPHESVAGLDLVVENHTIVVETLEPADDPAAPNGKRQIRVDAARGNNAFVRAAVEIRGQLAAIPPGPRAARATVTAHVPRVSGAPVAAPSGNAGGSIGPGLYAYRVAYVADDGTMSSAGPAATVDLSRRDSVALTSLPIADQDPNSPDPQVVARRVYRTKANELERWFQVAELADNVTTQTVDNTPDANLGAVGPAARLAIGWTLSPPATAPAVDATVTIVSRNAGNVAMSLDLAHLPPSWSLDYEMPRGDQTKHSLLYQSSAVLGRAAISLPTLTGSKYTSARGVIVRPPLRVGVDLRPEPAGRLRLLANTADHIAADPGGDIGGFALRLSTDAVPVLDAPRQAVVAEIMSHPDDLYAAAIGLRRLRIERSVDAAYREKGADTGLIVDVETTGAGGFEDFLFGTPPQPARPEPRTARVVMARLDNQPAELTLKARIGELPPRLTLVTAWREARGADPGVICVETSGSCRYVHLQSSSSSEGSPGPLQLDLAIPGPTGPRVYVEKGASGDIVVDTRTAIRGAEVLLTNPQLLESGDPDSYEMVKARLDVNGRSVLSTAETIVMSGSPGRRSTATVLEDERRDFPDTFVGMKLRYRTGNLAGFERRILQIPPRRLSLRNRLVTAPFPAAPDRATNPVYDVVATTTTLETIAEDGLTGLVSMSRVGGRRLAARANPQVRIHTGEPRPGASNTTRRLAARVEGVRRLAFGSDARGLSVAATLANARRRPSLGVRLVSEMAAAAPAGDALADQVRFAIASIPTEIRFGLVSLPRATPSEVGMSWSLGGAGTTGRGRLWAQVPQRRHNRPSDSLVDMGTGLLALDLVRAPAQLVASMTSRPGVPRPEPLPISSQPRPTVDARRSLGRIDIRVTGSGRLERVDQISFDRHDTSALFDGNDDVLWRRLWIPFVELTENGAANTFSVITASEADDGAGSKLGIDVGASLRATLDLDIAEQVLYDLRNSRPSWAAIDPTKWRFKAEIHLRDFNGSWAVDGLGAAFGDPTTWNGQWYMRAVDWLPVGRQDRHWGNTPGPSRIHP